MIPIIELTFYRSLPFTIEIERFHVDDKHNRYSTRQDCHTLFDEIIDLVMHKTRRRKKKHARCVSSQLVTCRVYLNKSPIKFYFSTKSIDIDRCYQMIVVDIMFSLVI
jgi:hypothetical protein